MIKYINIAYILVFFSSCSTMKQVDYFKYEKSNFSSFVNLELKVIDYRLATPKDYKIGYGNTYLCKDFKTNKIIRVVSTCTDVKFSKETYVVLYKCEKTISDTITIASDKKWEQDYKNTPVFFGKIAVPIQ